MRSEEGVRLRERFTIQMHWLGTKTNRWSLFCIIGWLRFRHLLFLNKRRVNLCKSYKAKWLNGNNDRMCHFCVFATK